MFKVYGCISVRVCQIYISPAPTIIQGLIPVTDPFIYVCTHTHTMYLCTHTDTHAGIYCRNVTLGNCGSWSSSLCKAFVFMFDAGVCGHRADGREDGCKVASTGEQEQTRTICISGIPQGWTEPVRILIASDLSVTCIESYLDSSI